MSNDSAGRKRTAVNKAVRLEREARGCQTRRSGWNARRAAVDKAVRLGARRAAVDKAVRLEGEPVSLAVTAGAREGQVSRAVRKDEWPGT